MRVVWAYAVIAFLCDQLSKYLVVHVMEVWRVRVIEVFPPLLTFRYGENRGINFGIGGDAVSPWVLIALALCVCGWLVWWIQRAEAPYLSRLCAGLVLGGALGNVFDRLLYGFVLDFLNMSCCGISNPYTFNVADIFIVGGAIGLVLVTPDPKKAA